jgi:hypothetical protein
MILHGQPVGSWIGWGGEKWLGFFDVVVILSAIQYQRLTGSYYGHLLIKDVCYEGTHRARQHETNLDLRYSSAKVELANSPSGIQ